MSAGNANSCDAQFLPPPALGQRLATGDSEAIEQTVAAGAADDASFDRRVFRKNPPAPDVAAAQAPLRAASAEALSRFAGFDPQPRAS